MQSDEREVFENLKKPLNELDVPTLIIDKIEGSTECARVLDLWVLTPSELCRQIGLAKEELTILLNEMEKVTKDVPGRRFAAHIERCRKYLPKDFEMIDCDEIYGLNKEKKNISIDEIDFSSRVRWSLINANIYSVEGILSLTRENILSIKHLNRTAIKEIMEQLEKVEVPFFEMHNLQDAYNDYYTYKKKLRDKVFKICLVEHMELIERMYNEKYIKDENELQSFNWVIKELGFSTIEEFWKYELSETGIILFLEWLIAETKANKIIWKSKQKHIYQTEDIRVFYSGRSKSLLYFNVTDRELLFCKSYIAQASHGKNIREKMKELYVLLDNKVRVVGRKDLEFFNWEKGDFEYPEWHSGVKYVMRHSDCDDEFFLPEESFHCSDEYTNASI